MKQKFTITGLDCPNCAAKLASQIEVRDGIESAKINFLTEKLTVESDLPAEDVLAIARTAAKAFDEDIVVE